MPCNPTWAAEHVDLVCGGGRVCCQTKALEPEDCVRDPQTGRFRPVTADDIGIRREDGTNVSEWTEGEHATHQDPDGLACRIHAGNDLNDPVFTDCARELTVANRRGFCTDPDDCCVDPDHETVCDRLN